MASLFSTRPWSQLPVQSMSNPSKPPLRVEVLLRTTIALPDTWKPPMQARALLPMTLLPLPSMS